MKLVNYYSRTGNNRRVAEYIAKKLNAENEEIREANRSDAEVSFGAVMGAIFRIKPKLAELKNDPEKADSVVVCSPIWAATVPGAVKAYVAKYNIKKLAIVSLNGGWKTKSISSLSKDSLMLKLPKGKEKVMDVSIFKKELDKFCNQL